MDAPAETYDGLLITYLAERDIPCPSCGYNLRALRAGRCPECGLGLLLRVQPAHPRLGAFILGLVGLSGGFGFSVLLLLFLVFRMFTKSFAPAMIEVAPLVGMAVLEGPLLLWWVLARRRTRRWRPVLVWSAAGAGWALSIALAATFLALVN
jgi:DNA-directed RNA polymerase subunit RPC12/RpoP